jgi:hypothetical protein
MSADDEEKKIADECAQIANQFDQAISKPITFDSDKRSFDKLHERMEKNHQRQTNLANKMKLQVELSKQELCKRANEIIDSAGEEFDEEDILD